MDTQKHLIIFHGNEMFNCFAEKYLLVAPTTFIRTIDQRLRQAVLYKLDNLAPKNFHTKSNYHTHNVLTFFG